MKNRIVLRKSFWLLVLAVASAPLLSACKSSEEHPKSEHPTSEHPTPQAPTTNAPAKP